MVVVRFSLGRSLHFLLPRVSYWGSPDVAPQYLRLLVEEGLKRGAVVRCKKHLGVFRVYEYTLSDEDAYTLASRLDGYNAQRLLRFLGVGGLDAECERCGYRWRAYPVSNKLYCPRCHHAQPASTATPQNHPKKTKTVKYNNALY